MLNLLIRTGIIIFLMQIGYVVLRRTLLGVLIFGSLKILYRMVKDLIILNCTICKYAHTLLIKKAKKEMDNDMGNKNNTDTNKKSDATGDDVTPDSRKVISFKSRKARTN